MAITIPDEVRNCEPLPEDGGVAIIGDIEEFFRLYVNTGKARRDYEELHIAATHMVRTIEIPGQY